MKVSAIRIGADRQLEPCDIDRALTEAQGESGLFWISVGEYQPADLDGFLARLNLDVFARNRLLKQGEITKVVPIEQGIIVDLRVVSSPSRDKPKQIALLCLKNLMIVLDPDPAEPLGAADSRLREFEFAAPPSTAGALLSIMLIEAKRTNRETREVRSEIFQLDERMDRDPASVDLDEILGRKDRLLKLLSVAEEQSEIFDVMTATEGAVLDVSALKGTTHLLLSVAGSSERMAERLEKRVADLRQRYDSHQQEKLNHRLAVLTMISAIFLPLSLVAGIWGMNFERMPELKHPMGYPIALTLMVCIVGGMLWFFRRRGWFD